MQPSSRAALKRSYALIQIKPYPILFPGLKEELAHQGVFSEAKILKTC